MNCPFFKEQRVKFCGLSGFRKMILLDAADTAHEVCSGPSYPRCALFRESRTRAAGLASIPTPVCPWLHESLVQYCTAAGIRKFVPASEPRLLRCGRPAYRYCDLYRATVTPDTADPKLEVAPPLLVPAHLGYAPNHMWMDQLGSRHCQIGVDAFLASIIQGVDQLSFLTVGGTCRPTVVITVRGVDLHLTFPTRILITAANLYLRAEPARLAADPYGAGWLFEGEPEEAGQMQRDLFPSTEAAGWMEKEWRRLESWVQERVQARSTSGRSQAGAGLDATWLDQLSREDLLTLFSEFFLTDEINRR